MILSILPKQTQVYNLTKIVLIHNMSSYDLVRSILHYWAHSSIQKLQCAKMQAVYTLLDSVREQSYLVLHSQSSLSQPMLRTSH